MMRFVAMPDLDRGNRKEISVNFRLIFFIGVVSSIKVMAG
jgi:hypothetical protein